MPAILRDAIQVTTLAAESELTKSLQLSYESTGLGDTPPTFVHLITTPPPPIAVLLHVIGTPLHSNSHMVGTIKKCLVNSRQHESIIQVLTVGQTTPTEGG